MIYVYLYIYGITDVHYFAIFESNCWFEAGGSTESVITATAPPTTNNHRSFQTLSPTLPADTLEAGRTVRVMHQMKKIQKTRLQYAKIRWEAFRSGEHGT